MQLAQDTEGLDVHIPVYLLVLATIGAVVSGAVAIKLLDRIRRKEAEAEAQNIVSRAEQEVANRRKEAELEIKESMIQQKAEMDNEINRSREEMRDRERKLDRRRRCRHLQSHCRDWDRYRRRRADDDAR